MVEIDEHVCVFNFHASLGKLQPYNGFSSNERSVIRGPLSPFMFLRAAEELVGFMQNDPQLGEFHPFKVIEDMQFELLLFADETIIMSEGS